MVKFLQYILNERGNFSGGGPSRQITQTPEPTAEQKEANKMAIDAAKLQAKEIKRALALTEKFAPSREALLKSQLEAVQQQLGLSQQATTELEKALQPTELQQTRGALEKLQLENALAQVRGEKSYISPQQEERLSGLEKSYIQSSKGDITSFEQQLRNDAIAMSQGFKPGANYMQQSQDEANRQRLQSEREGRLLGLGTRLNSVSQLQQYLEAQRQASARLGQYQQGANLNTMLELAGKPGGLSVPGGGWTTADGRGTTLGNVIDQMRQQREAQASSTTIGTKNRDAGAIQGAISGAITGASAGSVGGPWGALGGGVVGAIGGGIYGYNA